MTEPESTALPVVQDIPTLRNRIRDWRQAHKTIAFVPTMGALHAGHLALVEQAKAMADKVAVSIFVNPTQFGPAEDLSSYPRPEAEDWSKLNDAGVDLLYRPDASVMYPDGFETSVSVAHLSEGLCGACRPGHFDGVATVVAKLFLQVLPDMALFGEKDFQQLAIIRRMVRDLDLPVDVVGVPTVRDEDGLALSSRNAYLTAAERAVAPALFRELTAAAADIANGAEIGSRCRAAAEALLAAGFASVDYLEARIADGLEPLEVYGPAARVLGAAHLGKARLIDNVPVP